MLTKRELSLKFNVYDVAIYLWEKTQLRPSFAQIPKIIEFLGYDPFESKAEIWPTRSKPMDGFMG